MQFQLNELEPQKALATDLSNAQKTMGLHSSGGNSTRRLKRGLRWELRERKLQRTSIRIAEQ